MALIDFISLVASTTVTNGTTIINIQQTSSLELLLVAVAATLIGIVVGAAVSIKKEREKENRELKKVRNLIENDYREVYTNIVTGISAIENVTNTILTSNNLEDQIINTQSQQPIFPTELMNVIVNIHISFYDAIVHSGKLIMLDKQEIMAYQNFYEFTETTLAPLEQYYTATTKAVRTIVNQRIALDRKRNMIKNQLAGFLHFRLFGYRSIINNLDNTASYFSWLDYEQEPDTIA